VSSDVTLLDQSGSEVLLGETLMVPIGDSMVYLRPLYVAATTKPQPQLQYVVAVLGQRVAIESSLNAVLSDVLQTTVSLPSGGGATNPPASVPAAVSQDLQAAQNDYNSAQADLKQGNLSGYQQEIAAMQAEIAQAQQVLGPPPSATPNPASTSNTTSTSTPSTTPTSTPSSGTKTSRTGSTTTVPNSTQPQGSTTTSTTSPFSAAASP
jgi:hypothetical protein